MVNDLERFSAEVRWLCLNMTHNAGASHIGSALSIIDIASVLYRRVLRVEPDNPDACQRDRFILSKGHACVAIYAVLAKCGFFKEELLGEYGAFGSIFMNHVSHAVPGVEFSTGSLGHGLPFGTGKALHAKRTGAEWQTVVLLSDGELNEGSNWEALMFASHHKLSNLITIVDCNGLQSLTTTNATLDMAPLDDKFRSFGLKTAVIDGHDHEAIETTLRNAFTETEVPTVIIANTVKGKGVSFMENKVLWHYRPPSADDLSKAAEELGIDR
jgi:transketolase